MCIMHCERQVSNFSHDTFLNDLRKMPPPKLPVKRDAPATPTSSPSTPSAAPTTPSGSEEPKKKKPRKGAEDQAPLTAVQKAKDMCNKLLKKKNDAGNLMLTLQSLPYADALSKEMEKFAAQFEFLG